MTTLTLEWFNKDKKRVSFTFPSKKIAEEYLEDAGFDYNPDFDEWKLLKHVNNSYVEIRTEITTENPILGILKNI
jgi:hypothetical protein